MMPLTPRAATILAVLVMLVGLGRAAHAQMHEQNFGRYIVRANVVHGHALSQDAPERRRLKLEDNEALLDVVVLKTRYPPPDPVRAYVLVTVREPTGRTHDIEMRPVVADRGVSFSGAIPIPSPRVLMDFKITAYPEDDTALTMEFSEILYRGNSPR